jgi:hypothetical protein
MLLRARGFPLRREGNSARFKKKSRRFKEEAMMGPVGPRIGNILQAVYHSFSKFFEGISGIYINFSVRNSV